MKEKLEKYKILFFQDEDELEEGAEPDIDENPLNAIICKLNDSEQTEAMLYQLFNHIKKVVEEGQGEDLVYTFYKGFPFTNDKKKSIANPYQKILKKYPQFQTYFVAYLDFLIAQEQFYTSDGEYMLGLNEALALALFDKQYIQKLIELLTLDSALGYGDEYVKCACIGKIIDKWKFKDEVLNLLAFWTRQGDSTAVYYFKEVAEKYEFKKKKILFNRFLSAYFLGLQSCPAFNESRHHLIPEDFIKNRLETIDLDFDLSIWKVSLIRMVENAKEDQTQDFSAFIYVIGGEAEKEVFKMPKSIPAEFVEAYLNLAEKYTLLEDYEQSDIFLKPISEKNATPQEMTLKYFNHLLNLNAQGKAVKSMQENFNQAHEKESEMKNWTFAAFHPWLKKAKLNKAQKAFAKVLIHQIETGKEIHHHLEKRDKVKNTKTLYCYITNGNTLSYQKEDKADERETTTFDSQAEMEKAIEKLVAEKKEKGYNFVSTKAENKAFYEAIKKNDLDTLKKMLDNGLQLDYSLTFKEGYWPKPIGVALKYSNIETITFLLNELLNNYVEYDDLEHNQRRWNLIKKIDTDREDYNEVLNLILNSSYVVNKDFDLHFFNTGNLSLENLQLLFSKINWQGKDHGQFFQSACRENQPKSMNFLLEAGAKIAEDIQDRSIHYAVVHNMGLPMVKKLLKHGAVIPESDKHTDFIEAFNRPKNKKVKAYLEKLWS